MMKSRNCIEKPLHYFQDPWYFGMRLWKHIRGNRVDLESRNRHVGTVFGARPVPVPRQRVDFNQHLDSTSDRSQGSSSLQLIMQYHSSTPITIHHPSTSIHHLKRFCSHSFFFLVELVTSISPAAFPSVFLFWWRFLDLVHFFPDSGPLMIALR